jgi:hypothetical protein
MVLDRVSACSTVFAACTALVPKLNVGVELFNKWVV